MSLKILTVDDSKTIRMIVKKAFKPYDCILLEGENGVEGLAAASKEKPDLIVLDITMPVMTGVEMLEKLKSEPSLKEIPVIMLTAESGKENVMQIVKMGVKDYMVKPFKGDQLIERVSRIIKLEPKKTAGKTGDDHKKYFIRNEDILLLAFPENITRQVAARIESNLQIAIKEMSSSGIEKMVLDLRKMPKTNMLMIEMVGTIVDKCRNANINIRIAASAALGSELKGFQETKDIPISDSVKGARGTF